MKILSAEADQYRITSLQLLFKTDCIFGSTFYGLPFVCSTRAVTFYVLSQANESRLPPLQTLVRACLSASQILLRKVAQGFCPIC